MCFPISPIMRVASLLFFDERNKGIYLKSLNEYDILLLKGLRENERNVRKDNLDECKTYNLTGDLSDLKYQLKLFSKWFYVEPGFFEGYGKCCRVKNKNYDLDSYFQLSKEDKYIGTEIKRIAQEYMKKNLNTKKLECV